MDFGALAAGASATATVQVTNSTGASVTLTAITAGMADGSLASDFSQQSTCGTTLAVNASCVVTLTFTPTADGQRNGSLNLLLNGGISSQSAALIGTVPDFTLTAASSSASVAAGTAASYTLNVAVTAGLTGTVSFTCSNLPTYAACSFAPSSITLSSGGTTALSITTSQTVTTPGTGHSLERIETFSLAALCCLPLLLRRRTRGLLWVMLAMTLLTLSGCSGSSASSSKSPTTVTNLTPKGTYTITVTATGGTLVHTLPLTLTVQ